MLKRQSQDLFVGDFSLPVGTMTNSIFTHAVHGRLFVETLPKDMGRVGMKGEGRQ